MPKYIDRLDDIIRLKLSIPLITQSLMEGEVTKDLYKIEAEASAQIQSIILEEQIKELEYMKSQNVDCTELRHARHEGAWEQHLEFDADIDARISTLKSSLSALSGGEENKESVS